jgi:hypothetical protein
LKDMVRKGNVEITLDSGKTISALDKMQDKIKAELY